MSARKAVAGDGPYPLPDGWRWVKLEEVAEINPRDLKPADDTEISFVGMAQLDATTASAKPLETRTFSEVSKGYTVFRNRDVLVAKITPCWENGKIGQAELDHEVGVGSTEFHVVRPGGQLDSRYILHYLRQSHVRDTGELRMTGSAGQRRVQAKYLSDLKVPLASLAEQRRIAEILDSMNSLKSLQARVDALLGGLPGARFEEEFESDFGTVRLSDVAELSGGKSLVSKDQTIDSPYKVLKISSVTSGHFRGSEVKQLPPDYIPPVEHLVKKGDLLMSRANTSELVGATAYVGSVGRNIALPDKVWKFQWKIPGQNPIFYHSLLSSNLVRGRISALSSGSGGSMKNISKSKLLSMEIPEVSPERQRDYADFAESIYARRRIAMRQLENLIELSNSLQSRAFRGEL